MVRDKYLVLVGIALMLVVGLGFVLAGHTVTPTTITVDKGQPYRYNFTINNTEGGTGGGNITMLNITLPPSFSFIAKSNATYNNSQYLSHIFMNDTAQNLSWQNITGGGLIDVNVNNTYFWFNATASQVGMFNITIISINSTGGKNMSNVTVTVDGPPSVTLVSPVNGMNYSSSIVNFTVSSTDVASNTSSCWMSLSGNFTNYSMYTRVANTFNRSDASVADGNYLVKFLCNDTWSNYNDTITSNFTIDATAPSAINFTYISKDQTTLSFNISITDLTMGVSSSCIVNRSGAYISASTITGTGRLQNVTDTGLTCGTGYWYNVTCNDSVGNTNTTAGVAFETAACTVSTVTSSRSGGSSTITSQDLTNGYTKSVGIGDVITFRTTSTGANHNMVVLKVTATNATIQVASVPQKATLNIGEEKKFDINADNLYDVLVTLNSIAAGKASFTMKSISEAITSGTPTTTTETGTELETGTAETEGTTSAGMSTTAKTLMWVGITIAIVAVLYFIIRKFRKKGVEERILTGKKIR